MDLSVMEIRLSEQIPMSTGLLSPFKCVGLQNISILQLPHCINTCQHLKYPW